MRRGGLVALAVAGTLASALVIGGAHAAGRVSGPADGGYPQRIGYERPSRALPDRPGPLAATLYDNDYGVGRWVGVAARGRMYELNPSGPNLLSPDGGLLLTAEGTWDDSRLAVHDLRTGEVRVFDSIVQAASSSALDEGELRLDTYRPVHWSPDGSKVLGWFRNGRGGRTQVLDVATGEVTDVGGGTPAGFLASGEAVSATYDESAGVVVTTTDAASEQQNSTTMRLATPWLGGNARPAASVSPDGVLVLVEGAHRGDATLRMFDLADGAELPPRTVGNWDGCTPTFLGDDPVVPTATRGYRGSLTAGAELVTSDGTRPLVAVNHRMQSSCLRITTSALEDGAHPALFGTSTTLWTWYWWQLLLAAAAPLLLLALVVRHWSRRRRERRAVAKLLAEREGPRHDRADATL